MLCPISQRPAQAYPENNTNVGLVGHRCSWPWRWDISHLLSPFLFPSGDQWCDVWPVFRVTWSMVWCSGLSVFRVTWSSVMSGLCSERCDQWCDTMACVQRDVINVEILWPVFRETWSMVWYYGREAINGVILWQRDVSVFRETMVRWSMVWYYGREVINGVMLWPVCV